MHPFTTEQMGGGSGEDRYRAVGFRGKAPNWVCGRPPPPPAAAAAIDRKKERKKEKKKKKWLL
jgi:hypothetical protein